MSRQLHRTKCDCAPWPSVVQARALCRAAWPGVLCSRSPAMLSVSRAMCARGRCVVHPKRASDRVVHFERDWPTFLAGSRPSESGYDFPVQNPENCIFCIVLDSPSSLEYFRLRSQNFRTEHLTRSWSQ